MLIFSTLLRASVNLLTIPHQSEQIILSRKQTLPRNLDDFLKLLVMKTPIINAADPIESAGESESDKNFSSESDLPTAKAASFRLNHPWVAEVKKGIFVMMRVRPQK